MFLVILLQQNKNRKEDEISILKENILRDIYFVKKFLKKLK